MRLGRGETFGLWNETLSFWEVFDMISYLHACGFKRKPGANTWRTVSVCLKVMERGSGWHQAQLNPNLGNTH